jgi:hypothetical protein
MAESGLGLIGDACMAQGEPTSSRMVDFVCQKRATELAGDTASAITAHEQFPSPRAARVGDSMGHQSAAILMNADNRCLNEYQSHMSSSIVGALAFSFPPPFNRGHIDEHIPALGGSDITKVERVSENLQNVTITSKWSSVIGLTGKGAEASSLTDLRQCLLDGSSHIGSISDVPINYTNNNGVSYDMPYDTIIEIRRRQGNASGEVAGCLE